MLIKNKYRILPLATLFLIGLLIIFPKKVTVDNNGFNPNSIHIVKGSNVTWVSKGDLPHWPASDPHPVHTDYPSKEKGCVGSSLDACKELKNGESYSFTFDKVGSWGIHDHLFHSHTMTVNVYDNYLQLLIGKIKSVVTGLKDKFSKQPSAQTNTDLNQAVSVCSNQDRTKFIFCLKNVLKDLIGNSGVKKLLSQLETSYKKNDFSSQGGITRCHDIAHAIGQAGVSAAKDSKTVLSQCTDLCTSGCFHGAIEQSVLQQSADAFLGKVSNLCSDPACFHGLGHGLASIAGYDLQKSLTLCDRLKEHNDKRNCGFGVFMEIYEPSSFNPIPKALPEDLLTFCGGLSGVYLEVCYRNIGSYEYSRTKQDITKGLDMCRSIPQNYQRECRVALGQQIYFNQRGNSQNILNLCRSEQKPEFKDCIDGAIMSSVSSDPLARHGFELCSQVNDEIKPDCYQFLGGHIQAVYGQKSRLENCKQVKENMLIYNECSGTNSQN